MFFLLLYCKLLCISLMFYLYIFSMMKKSKLFSLLSIFLLWLIVAGCETKQPVNTEIDNTQVDNIKLPENEIVDVLKWFADDINVDYSNIKEDYFQWYNYSENDIEIPDIVGWYYDLDGYSISVSGLKNLPNTNKVFDGWYVFYAWDAIWAAAIEFSKDDILCHYYQWLEQDIPDELLAWDGDEEADIDAFNAAWEEFQENATYSVELYCGYLTGTIQHKDFYFDAEWQEPFWYASFRWSLLNIFTPDWMQEKYISTLKMDGDDIVFKWYDLKWKIEKSECIDGWKWDTHEYTVSFDVSDEAEPIHYEGCADRSDLGFVTWEEWTMVNFMNKANYNYTRGFDLDNVYYSIGEIVDNYVSVNIYEVEEYDYDTYQIILEKSDGGWNVLFEWNGYEISPEECEELNQYDHNLMDMFFLITCPRG